MVVPLVLLFSIFISRGALEAHVSSIDLMRNYCANHFFLRLASTIVPASKHVRLQATNSIFAGAQDSIASGVVDPKLPVSVLILSQ